MPFAHGIYQYANINNYWLQYSKIADSFQQIYILPLAAPMGRMPMEVSENHTIEQLLDQGWVIVGYSTTIMAAGAMTHSILLKKESGLIQFTIVTNGGVELTRHYTVLSPTPPKQEKKGWF